MEKIVLLKKSDEELMFEVHGESHTILNLLQITLLKNKNVKTAGYTVPHRLVDSAIFNLKTSGEDSLKVLMEAFNEVKSQAEEFRKSLDKSLKEYAKKK